MMKSSRGFVSVPVLIIILALIAGATAYFVRTESQLLQTPSSGVFSIPSLSISTKDETAGWKTYRNEKYSYSINHPSDYTLQVSRTADCFAAKPDSDGPIFCIFPHENSKNLSAREWWNTQEEGSSSLIEANPIEVAGEQALVFESEPDSFPMTNIIFTHGDKVFVIDSNTPYENEMLSSFKFIPPQTPTLGECQQDSDCKLIYSSCGCESIPKSNLQTILEEDVVCKRNECSEPTLVVPVCRNNRCQRNDK